MRTIFNKFIQMHAGGQVNLETANIEVMLYKGLPPSEDYNFLSEMALADNELQGVGYSRKPLLNKTLLRDDATNSINFSADSVAWNDLYSNGNITGHLFYIKNTNDGDSVPVLFSNEGGYPLVMNGGKYELSIVEPILTIQQSKDPKAIEILLLNLTDTEKVAQLKALFGV